MRRASVVVTALTSGILVLGFARAKADFPEMTRRVPKDANVVMYMDVERVMASPMAQKEDWKGKRAADFASRPMAIPPSVTKLLRAASINLDVDETAWQIAVMEASTVPSLEVIAKHEKGYIDTVAGTKAVWSPRGAYAFKITDKTVGLMFPANRQYLSRWIKEKTGQLSSYLLDSSNALTSTGPQLVVALDVEDLVQPQLIQERAKQMQSLKNAKVNIDDVVKTVLGIKGIRFSVTLKDKAIGKITVDFGGDASALKDVGKPLLLEVLEHRGLALEDLDSWKASVSKNSFTLEGDLSKSGLMRLSSLLEFPSLPLDESAPEPVVDAKDPKLYATEAHFKSVTALLADLNEKRKEFTNPGHAAGWWETYAKRIDRLPVLNVDPEMQEYSATIAELMRQAAGQGRGAGIRTGVQQANLAVNYTGSYGYSGYGYGYGGDRYSGARQQAAERNAIRAQETGQVAMSASEIRTSIQDATSDIRRKMTQKYNVEF